MNLKLSYSKIENEKSATLAENDYLLWEAFKGGDQQALAIMYQQHFFKLYNYGMKITTDAELVKDCIQDLFIHIWNKRNSLSATNSIKYYLFKALRRKVIEEIKKNKLSLSTQKEFHNFVFEMPQEEKIIQIQISSEQKTLLTNWMNKLPKREKEALFLRYYENLSPQEVSSIMSLNIDSTYVLLSKALRFLKNNMQKTISFLLPALLLLKQ